MTSQASSEATRNLVLYPWFRFFQGLLFSQSIWFLYFQSNLSSAEAILLYAITDIAITVLEVPSGYASDRFGRRATLILAAACASLGAMVIGLGDTLAAFAVGQVLIAAGGAFASGTDSAFLYESLFATDRTEEVEEHELRAWRFSFAGHALSAAMGGALAMASLRYPFLMQGLALATALGIALGFRPVMARAIPDQPGEAMRLASLRAALGNRLLWWFFALAMAMYVFSHLPFVFGQPFIQNALDAVGLGQDAPMVSGAITATMMAVSVVASWWAPRLRRCLGLMRILLFAFAMQIALSGVIALTDAPILMAVLALRMVPDAFSRPFIIARIQPLLNDDVRATYLSVQSLAGRLVFATSLMIVSQFAGQAGEMSYSEIQRILAGYLFIGLMCLIGFILTGRRLRIDLEKPVGRIGPGSLGETP